MAATTHFGRWLPPEDRSRSARTGWVRAHWEATADHILDGVRAHTSADGSFVKTAPQQSSMTGLEGFARGALLAAYRIAGDDDAAGRDALISWLGKGVEVGTRRDGPGSWPLPVDHAQSIVEAAWVAIALAETRAAVWDQLDAAAQRDIVQWLAAVRGKAVFPNNWLLYPVVVDGFLQQVSGPTDPAATARALRQVDAMYHRDGWYSDGPGDCFGHYSAWGMQLLLAHFVRVTGGDAFPGGADAIRERMREFLGEYVHLIGNDGSPVVHGRSPVYRIAVAAPFWLGELLDATPFPSATTRSLASSVLRHFTLRGALEEGIPAFGWYGAFPAIADSYSTPLSTLMASEAFVGLLLPADHPVWTADEPDVPPTGSVARVLTTPGFVCTASDDGVVRMASHGASSPAVAAHPGYRRIGYSNRSAPATGSLGARDVDGQVSVLTGAGNVLRRHGFVLLGAGDRYAASTWVPEVAPRSGKLPRLESFARRLPRRMQPRALRARPVRHDRVETASLARPDMELRISHLWSLDGGVLRDGGLAVSHDRPPVVTQGEGWCAVTTADGLTGAVIGLFGWGGSGWVGGEAASPFGAHSVVPYVDGDGRGPESVLVSAHILTSGTVDPEAVRASVSIEMVGHRIVVARMADGEEHLVQLYRPVAVRLQLGAHSVDGIYRYARSSSDGSFASVPAS
ncbi:MAG TPA: DUF2264 domain-containing protein [Acidimicrobiia bacterium]|nr:DUF2264 domain-containing protein [Acidimicrobiia bacterium]